MASFYLPMALSYASNLSHMPPINGLYAFVFNPLVYALLGTCPQMVVGPEAAGSLLVGSVVSEAIKAGKFRHDDGMKAAQVGGMVTGLAGGIILLAGLLRLGFLDSVLSRPFLRGFISSIGLVIFVNQLVPEMGLDKAAEHSAKAHGSPLDSLIFMSENGDKISKITCAISFGAVGIILVCRELKRRLQPLPKLGWVVYFPDRFIIVALSAVFCWYFQWNRKGVDILGDVQAPAGVHVFEPHGILAKSNFKHVNDAFETAFIIALLGFFESCVAAKSLGAGTSKTETVQKTKEDGTVEDVEETDGIRGMTVSSNRELVALGIANLIGGTFMAIPAFGGYGRSKVNASTGGKTPMSSIFLSLITVVCTLFLLPYFYYIPVGRSAIANGRRKLTSITERSPVRHDNSRFHFIVRRSTPRHRILLEDWRLSRTLPYAPHLLDHILLVPARRHYRRHHLLPHPALEARYTTTHPDRRPNSRHSRVRQRRSPRARRPS
jgi:MFS superfamily sulfate permease-like transporter